MVTAAVVEVGVDDDVVGVAPEVADRLAGYFADVVSGLGRVEQRRAAQLYARGLIEAGARKSLEPIVARLGGGKVEYEALQHFLADSPWDPAVVDRAVAERVCAVIEPESVFEKSGRRWWVCSRRVGHVNRESVPIGSHGRAVGAGGAAVVGGQGGWTARGAPAW